MGDKIFVYKWRTRHFISLILVQPKTVEAEHYITKKNMKAKQTNHIKPIQNKS